MPQRLSKAMQVFPVTRRTIVFAAAVALGVVIFIAYLVLRPQPSLPLQAKWYVEAALQGDVKTLWGSSIEKIRGDTGLTANNVEEVWRNLIEPRLARFSKRGPVQANPPVNGFQGSAIAELETPDGKKSFLGITMFSDGSGHAIGRIMSFLKQAWRLEYVADGGDTSIDYASLAFLAGLKKDRETLEALGIIGFAPLGDPTEPVQTWDEILARLSAEAD